MKYDIRECSSIRSPLPLSEMVGVAWFQCNCGRKFAGFCKGNVTSKCHNCSKEVKPAFIVPGDDAASSSRKFSHCCSVCQGSGACPIVAQARESAGKRRFH